jgi:hypothetical protein
VERVRKEKLAAASLKITGLYSLGWMDFFITLDIVADGS